MVENNIAGDTRHRRLALSTVPGFVRVALARAFRKRLTIVVGCCLAAAGCVAIFVLATDRATKFWAHGRGEHGEVLFLSFNAGWLIAADADKTSIWQLHPLTKMRSLEGAAAAISPDHRILATVRDSGVGWKSWRRVVTLYDVDSMREMTRLTYSGVVSAIGIEREPPIIIAGVQGEANPDAETIIVRRWDTGRLEKTVDGVKGVVWTTALSPDKKLLAADSSDATVTLWRTNDWKVVAVLGGHRERVTHIAFSPDGRTLATSSSNAVKLWDVIGVKELVTLDTPGTTPSSGSSLAFHPSGHFLASGDDRNGSVAIWEVPSGKLARVVRKEEGSRVRALAFSQDGKLLAAGINVGQVQLWDLPDLRRSER